mmetsp:Transcript_28751/g.39742  ORF Transcript_28751/g.39742 Transcript_28751/m.39742 type:complete len:356 (+) Transcript_28751:110-1177(+)|eukprot:CAMPEP_0196585900 /NCGR_PEP_ID=MMETSP1081-20130531/52476_1 /TAXON_ID=36882 /ORGANISM="Pyramimonas amylifera, Strain CCMP720" /LENGTH=355 /DNA_ID=CAMNT_0041907601 /DNA_START=90 /DNA_END=1157 /DNA_ORIENTATION=+
MAFPVEIRTGLFLGDRAAGEALATDGNPIFSRVISLGCPIMKITNFSQLSFPCLLDEETANLLELLPDCVSYIKECLVDERTDLGENVNVKSEETKISQNLSKGHLGRSKPGTVLVHCEAGRSRSVAVICAYLMKTESLNFEKSLAEIKIVAPLSQPNDGFAQQLRLFSAMGCTIDPTRPAYRHFRAQQLALKRQNEGWLDAAALAEALPGMSGEGGGVDGELYRCRKCRRVLGTHASVLPHEQGEGQSSFKYRKQGAQPNGQGSGGACTSVFLEPLAWMHGSGITEGGYQVEGKLQCPQCAGRLGSFNWAGEQCSCGSWVTPAFQVHKTKIDVIRAIPPPSSIRQPCPLVVRPK